MEESGEGGDQNKDRLLPFANVKRIMKKGLPAHGKVSKDATELVQECVSEFIFLITSEASDKCIRENRKTINGDDLLSSMETCGFDDYIPTVRLYLKKYREIEQTSEGGSTSGGVIQRPLGSHEQFVPLQASSSQAMGFGSNFPGSQNHQTGQGPSSSRVTGFGSNFPGYNVPNAQIGQVGPPSPSQAFNYGSNLPGFNVPNPQIGHHVEPSSSQAFSHGSNLPGFNVSNPQIGQQMEPSSSQAFNYGSNLPGFNVPNPQIGHQVDPSSSQAFNYGSNLPGFIVPNAQIGQVGPPSPSQAFNYGSNLPGFNGPQIGHQVEPSSSEAFNYGSYLPGFSVPNAQIGQGHYSQAIGFGSNFPGYVPYAQVGQGPPSSSQAMGLGPNLPGFSVPNAGQIGQLRPSSSSQAMDLGSNFSDPNAALIGQVEPSSPTDSTIEAFINGPYVELLIELKYYLMETT